MKSRLIPLLTLSLLLPATLARAAEHSPQAARDTYLRHAALPACTAGEVISLDLPLAAETEFSYDAASGRLRVFYPMQFNDLTEGWNWHPEEVAAGRDYYPYKYLPLGSIPEARGSYRTTDPAGRVIDYPIEWRWDYFFAFDNPYEFYPRDAGEDAGFAFSFAVSAAEAERLRNDGLRLSLQGRLQENCVSESTTFWKATASAPVDFTLKKRYLVGRLEAVGVRETATGRLLARRRAGERP